MHLKLDTGMGRYGLAELPRADRERRRPMTHLATADSRPRLRASASSSASASATEPLPELPTRHAANSAAALRLPDARFDAARCGVALYGLSPFGTRPGARTGSSPCCAGAAELAQVKQLEPGESTGYGRRFVAERPTWIGLVPVGYADGFRRDLTGTEVLVAGERAPGGRDRLDGLVRGRVARELPSGDAGDARRRRRARRGARERARGRSTTSSRAGSSRARSARGAGGRRCVRPREVLAGEDAWIVGGAIRDELLGRQVLDLDIACRRSRGGRAARRARAGGARLPALRARTAPGGSRYRDGRTVDFTPLADGIERTSPTATSRSTRSRVPLAGGASSTRSRARATSTRA